MKKLVYMLLVVGFYSCSSSHNIYINNDDSAKIDFSASNKESLTTTLEEWGLIQDLDSSSIIDMDLMKEELEKNKHIKNVKIISINNDNYLGNFEVDDIGRLFETSTQDIPEELRIFSIRNNGDNKELKVQISLRNYLFLKQSIPILNQESIDMLGPDANQGITKEEYLDMMSFSLGDNGPKDILDSSITLNLSFEGSVLQVNGGNKIDKHNVKFVIPLIDLILLHKPIEYSVVYKKE